MKYLTVVYEIPDNTSVAEITSNPHMTAVSWSHAIRERDALRVCLETPIRKETNDENVIESNWFDLKQ